MLAVVIVSWNTRDLTLDALRTLYADLDANGPDAQVWVLDNASSDGSAEAIRAAFPQAHVIAHDTNLGFAGGNNYVLRHLGFSDQTGSQNSRNLPKAVYLLNSDTRTQLGATRALYDALFSLPAAGVVGARLEYGDGSFQHGAFRFPDLGQIVVDLFPVPGRLYDSSFNGRYSRPHWDGTQPFPVDHTLGATMMLRCETIQQTGLFDERYFMYCEEIDWSMRIHRAGWKIYAVPTARIVHLAGQSTRQAQAESVVNLWRSRILLFERYYSPLTVFLARRLIRLGMRRKIGQARRDRAAGTLSAAHYDALTTAYRTVQRL